MYKKLILGAITAIGLVEYRRYMALYDNISANVRNFKLDIKGDTLKINFQIEVTNNSNKSIDVEQVFGKMFIGNVFVGNYNTNQTSTIKSNQISFLPITATINSSELLKNIEGKIFDSKIITLETNAKIRYKLIGLLNVPFFIKNTVKIDASSTINSFVSFVKKIKDIFG